MTEDWRALATHLIDQLDAAMAELAHHLATGDRVQCGRCEKSVPATSGGEPVRHQVRGQWCVDTDKLTKHESRY